MNKKGQLEDAWEILKFIILIPILLAVAGAVISVIHTADCPACECSTFQNQVQECNKIVENLSTQIKERPIEYIQNISYVEVPVEKIVYKERAIPITINIIALLLSIGINLSLFKIKFPKELEKELKKIEKWIIRLKWGSFVLTLLIFIKLSIILIW